MLAVHIAGDRRPNFSPEIVDLCQNLRPPGGPVSTQRQMATLISRRSWAGIYKEGRTFKVEPLR
jgi:hypothetical protein